MNLPLLAALNVKRAATRTTLTIVGVAVAVLTFLLLRTVNYSYTISAESAAEDRVVTRHKVTFVMPLPLRYFEDVKNTPGVTQVTYANWWGGRDPKDEQYFFPTFAVQEDYFTVYDEMVVPPEQLAAWKADRKGAIIGRALAKKKGWKVGDKVRLESTIFAGDYEFNIHGIYDAARKSVDQSQLVFHWAYLNESLPEGFGRDQIGWVISRVSGSAAEVGRKLDAKFEERDTQTISQDERAFQSGFLGMFTAVLTALDVVSVAILLILMMILGNTIAIGVRERTSEYGVLRAIGFLPKHLVLLVVAEAAVVGLVGGLAGLGLAYVIVQGLIGGFIETEMGGMFPYFRIGTLNAVLALAAALLLALLGSLLPARQVAKLKVVDALRRIG